MLKTSKIDKDYFILDFLRRRGGGSRQELARHFHMNAATVGNVVGRLLQENLLIEPHETAAAPANGAGRPRIQLQINPEAGGFVGANFNSDTACVSLVNFAGTPISTLSQSIDNADRNTVIEVLNDLLARVVADVQSRNGRIFGIGLGVPGSVDAAAGRAISYRRIRDWQNVHLAEIVGHAQGLPVFLEQNSNCFALGEAYLGEAAAYRSVAAIVIRTGIGMGLVRDREIFRFSTISAGNLGHLTIQPKGSMCWCGNHGCLETLISGWVLPRKIRRVAQMLGVVLPEAPVTPQHVCQLAMAGDPLSVTVLDEMFAALGIAVADLIRLLSPEVIVINGVFNAAKDQLLRQIKQTLQERLTREQSLPELVVSSSDDAVGAAGAAIAVAMRMFSPTPPTF